jgi:hypothetical protein
MEFKNIVALLPATVTVPGTEFDRVRVRAVVASDLMSDVLTVDKEDFILVTSLSSDQVARTADIVGASGIILACGRSPQPGLIRLARENGLTLLTTSSTMFRTCYLLGKALEAEGLPV